MKLVKHNDTELPFLNEVWTIHFYDHKPLDFTSKTDVEKYLRRELVEGYGYGFMEYERVPNGVTHTEYYDINYDE